MSTFDAADREAEGRDAAARDNAAPGGAMKDGGSPDNRSEDGTILEGRALDGKGADEKVRVGTAVSGEGVGGGVLDGVRREGSDESSRAALVTEVERLREEVGQLHRAIESRAVIDQARGMAMVMCRCSPTAAWEVLVEVSQHTNTKLRAVAGALVATTDGSTRMPQELSTALAEALRRRRGRRHPKHH